MLLANNVASVCMGLKSKVWFVAAFPSPTVLLTTVNYRPFELVCVCVCVSEGNLEANDTEGNEDEVWMEWLEGGASGSAGQSDVEANMSGLNLHMKRNERWRWLACVCVFGGWVGGKKLLKSIFARSNQDVKKIICTPKGYEENEWENRKTKLPKIG